jgi:hypothetical protein
MKRREGKIGQVEIMVLPKIAGLVLQDQQFWGLSCQSLLRPREGMVTSWSYCSRKRQEETLLIHLRLKSTPALCFMHLMGRGTHRDSEEWAEVVVIGWNIPQKFVCWKLNP